MSNSNDQNITKNVDKLAKLPGTTDVSTATASNIPVPTSTTQSLVTNHTTGRMWYTMETNPNDVLLGRGTHLVKYHGNIEFRRLIVEYRQEYVTTVRHRDKDLVARKVIRTIHDRDGRFLRKVDEENDKLKMKIPIDVEEAWVIVDEDVVLEKIKQAFRDSCKDGPSSFLTPSTYVAPKSKPHQQQQPTSHVAHSTATTTNTSSRKIPSTTSKSSLTVSDKKRPTTQVASKKSTATTPAAATPNRNDSINVSSHTMDNARTQNIATTTTVGGQQQSTLQDQSTIDDLRQQILYQQLYQPMSSILSPSVQSSVLLSQIEQQQRRRLLQQHLAANSLNASSSSLNNETYNQLNYPSNILSGLSPQSQLLNSLRTMVQSADPDYSTLRAIAEAQQAVAATTNAGTTIGNHDALSSLLSQSIHNTGISHLSSPYAQQQMDLLLAARGLQDQQLLNNNYSIEQLVQLMNRNNELSSNLSSMHRPNTNMLYNLESRFGNHTSTSDVTTLNSNQISSQGNMPYDPTNNLSALDLVRRISQELNNQSMQATIPDHMVDINTGNMSTQLNTATGNNNQSDVVVGTNETTLKRSMTHDSCSTTDVSQSNEPKKVKHKSKQTKNDKP